jgi:hypothetical protein
MTNLDRLVAYSELLLREAPHIGHSLGEPDKKGVRWLSVGRNASHSFEIGVDAEDRVWRRSSGEDIDQAAFEAAGSPNDRSDEFWIWQDGEPTLVEGGWEGIGYVGHW